MNKTTCLLIRSFTVLVFLSIGIILHVQILNGSATLIPPAQDPLQFCATQFDPLSISYASLHYLDVVEPVLHVQPYSSMDPTVDCSSLGPRPSLLRACMTFEPQGKAEFKGHTRIYCALRGGSRREGPRLDCSNEEFTRAHCGEHTPPTALALATPLFSCALVLRAVASRPNLPRSVAT